MSTYRDLLEVCKRLRSRFGEKDELFLYTKTIHFDPEFPAMFTPHVIVEVQRVGVDGEHRFFAQAYVGVGSTFSRKEDLSRVLAMVGEARRLIDFAQKVVQGHSWTREELEQEE